MVGLVELLNGFFAISCKSETALRVLVLLGSRAGLTDSSVPSHCDDWWLCQYLRSHTEEDGWWLPPTSVLYPSPPPPRPPLCQAVFSSLSSMTDQLYNMLPEPEKWYKGE